MAMLLKLLIPIALATAVIVSAATAPTHRAHVKPEPQRSLSSNR
jgi:hypothetical protein